MTTYKTAYWDAVAQEQKERDCTPEEIAEIELRKLPAPIIERRDAAWERIKAERDRRKFGGVKVGADWFHCDLESRSQWERMANKADKLGLTGADAYTIGGQPVPWKTMAGAFVVLTAGKIFAVVDAIELQEALIFGRAQQHIAAVQVSDTPESYDFSTGWPQMFEAL